MGFNLGSGLGGALAGSLLLGPAGGLAGGLFSQNTNKSNQGYLSGFGQGALSGAASGSAAGPWGAVLGFGAGGAAGLAGEYEKQKRQKLLEKQYGAAAQRQALLARQGATSRGLVGGAQIGAELQAPGDILRQAAESEYAARQQDQQSMTASLANLAELYQIYQRLRAPGGGGLSSGGSNPNSFYGGPPSWTGTSYA
jgi:hypothetical protein